MPRVPPALGRAGGTHLAPERSFCLSSAQQLHMSDWESKRRKKIVGDPAFPAGELIKPHIPRSSSLGNTKII